MSYNGSGTFNINSTGQPVVAGTVITASAFNALTTDLATGLTTAITKDGQTTTTARITFAQGITSSLVTDSSSTSTGSIITAGGAGIAKNLYVGVNANVAGTLGVTGVATFSAAPIYSSLTASSAVATDASKGLVSVTNTGTGNNVLATSPTLVTPILGTPQSGTLTNCTGLPTTALTGAITEANGGTGTNTGYYGFKNRIINGAMVIDQRNAGASVTPVNDQYSVDRWSFPLAQASKLSFQQNANSVTPPAGFINYLGITSLSAYSITSTDYFLLQQRIEGLNMADFGWGTANASTVTLSFWVRSSLTGTFSGSLSNASFNRSYPFSYTISSANTWEYKTITITGDTSGTWLTTNGIGVNLRVTMGSGSTRLSTGGSWQAGNYDGVTGTTSVVGTNGATFYITGVQLEKGSTATSFDYRPYGTELQLCQRYYYRIQSSQSGNRIGVTSGIVNSSTLCLYCSGGFPATMRTSPTSTQSGLNIADGSVTNSITSISNTTSMPNGFSLSFTTGTATLTSGRTGFIIGSNNSSDYIDFSAEL